MTEEIRNEDEEYEEKYSEAEAEGEEEYDEEYEDEAEDTEASDESEDEESAEGEEDSVESWGYEEKKSRFSREFLGGAGAITVLVAIFCVVVAKKFPGNDEAGEVAGPPAASLGSEGLGSGEIDPNDPFAPGAGAGVPSNPGGVADPNTDPLLSGSQTDPTNGGSGDAFDPLGSELQSEPGQPGIDPFAPGSSDSAGSNLIASSLPGSGGSSSGAESGTQDLFSPTSTTGGSGDPLGSGQPFGSQGSSTVQDPFGSAGSSLADTGTSRPGISQPERDSVFGGTGSASESTTFDPLASTGVSADPFGSADSLTSTTESGRSDLTSQPGTLSSDPFAPGNQLAQNDSSTGTATVDPFAPSNDQFSGDQQVNRQPTGIDPFGSGGSDPLSGATDGSSSLTSEPFGTGTTSDTTVDPFAPADPPGSEGALTDSSASGTSDLFSGQSELSAAGSELAGDSTTGSPDPFGTADPFRSSPSLGTESGLTDTGTSSPDSLNPIGTPDPFSTSTGSPDSTIDPFGSSTAGSSTPGSPPDPFGQPEPGNSSLAGSELNSGSSLGSDQPASLFPETGSSLPASSAASTVDPFQPPRTSSDSDPFGNRNARPSSTGRSQLPRTVASSPAVNTGTYIIQDGDSLWKISKKVYGTAKYFEVLGNYNSKQIPDPQKMRAGQVLQTPDASVLQSMLKTVRPSTPTGLAGRIDIAGSPAGSGSSGRTTIRQPSPAASSQPSGILFNEQGYPMFRVGENHNLTTIASDHLGRASRWKQIFNMNRDQLQSPDELQIGMLLKLPADASRVPLVDRTSSLR